MKVFASGGYNIAIDGDVVLIEAGLEIPKKHLTWFKANRPELITEAADPVPLKSPDDKMADTSGMKTK